MYYFLTLQNRGYNHGVVLWLPCTLLSSKQRTGLGNNEMFALFGLPPLFFSVQKMGRGAILNTCYINWWVGGTVLFRGSPWPPDRVLSTYNWFGCLRGTHSCALIQYCVRAPNTPYERRDRTRVVKNVCVQYSKLDIKGTQRVRQKRHDWSKS